MNHCFAQGSSCVRNKQHKEKVYGRQHLNLSQRTGMCQWLLEVVSVYLCHIIVDLGHMLVMEIIRLPAPLSCVISQQSHGE